MTTTCRGCGRPIVWGITPEGKRIPLDPRPAVYILDRETPDGGTVTCVRAPLAMVTHFATCPKASDFSRSKQPPAPPATKEV